MSANTHKRKQIRGMLGKDQAFAFYSGTGSVEISCPFVQVFHTQFALKGHGWS